MEHIANFIVDRRKAIIVVFVVLALISTPLAMLTKVNYDLLDYLPALAQSTTAIELMAEEFADEMPNTEVMISELSLAEALSYKQELAEVEGVTAVLWLDDVVDVTKPLEIADAEVVEQYYKDDKALFQVTIAEGSEQASIRALQELVGVSNAVGGQSSSTAAIQSATVKEVSGAFLILIPAIILILALSTRSWLEPLLLLVSIGVAILLNMGTNIIYDDVSFITNSVSPILQLAVSLDYAIFLLHSFSDYRKQYGDANVAMKYAIKTSFSTVASSATTTLFGFLALVFMEFLIGADLGINLTKGIIFSFLSAMVFLPALTLATYKLADRLQHRPLLPDFKNVHRVLGKLAIPVSIIVILAVVPAFLGQSRTDFLYGAESAGAGSRAQVDSENIREEFGINNLVVTLVPKGDVVKEQQLGEEYLQLDYVRSVMSYAENVGTTIPPEAVTSTAVNQFYSENYARLLVNVDLPLEGEATFAAMAELYDLAQSYYGDEAYQLGRSANLSDMRSVVQSDNLRVSLIAIIAIFLVLMITFRSAVTALILTFTIEAAIWINLSVPYFTGTNVNYIGYLVLQTVQLGATVDYAILLTNTYMRLRKTFPKRETIPNALHSNFKSILVSATTLSMAGFVLFATSTNPIVCDIGLMLGRGTILSFILVVCFLPLALKVFDPLIGRLTRGSNFYERPLVIVGSDEHEDQNH